MTLISDSLQAMQANILQASNHANRTGLVKLLAVSKSQSADQLRAAYLAGQTAFGENYVQEAIMKQSELADCKIEWHFIGPIQSNKAQLIAQHFDWVQSVDRLKIAQRLSKARGEAALPPLNICIQINSSNEFTKSGTQAEELHALAKEVIALPHIKLRGLMAIPAPTNNIEKQHDQFRIVKASLTQLQQSDDLATLELDTLSIGMSGDYVAAIEEGATIVRIGSALFGARQKPSAA
jgi:pyridoxal phosphate enzyme (YggS family)